MSFGRKGLAPGAVAAAAPGGFGRAKTAAAENATNVAQADADDIAAKREAFIAAERARRGEQIGEGSLPEGGDPLASLRNTSRPAARPAEPFGRGAVGETGLPVNQEEQIRAAARSMTSGQRSSAPTYADSGAAAPPRKETKFFFGDPAGRSLGIAYLIWFVIGQTGMHRVYCGHKDSAIIQVALLVVSVVTLFIFPPIGMVGFLAWVCWIVGDLFMMPGMLRKFKAQHDYARAFE